MIESGSRFGMWVAMESSSGNHKKIICKCDCGKERGVTISNLVTGKSNSCGCIRNYIPGKMGGMSCSQEYGAWKNMLKRTLDPRTKSFYNYGGRGIGVSAHWINSFEIFVRDMGRKPTPKHTLERIDNNGPYCKDNCRWATREEQNANRVNTKIVEWKGEKITTTEFARRIGKNKSTVRVRLWKGESPKSIAQKGV